MDRLRLWGALALLLLFSVSAAGQTFRGTVLGTVTDKTGGAVSMAKVTVRNVDTSLARETQTSDDGSYSVPELPIGNYTVTVEKSGFQTSVTTGVRVDVAVERRVDVVLQPGELAQRIEVSGETLPLTDTTSNVLGGIIEPSQTLNLPINARDYGKLIFMVPGVAGSPDQITDSPGSFGVFSINGARGRANNFLLDGTDMNDGYRNDPAINEAGVFGTPATILPVEAIAELRVLSNYEAEYGRNAGAVINIVTKSGTNEFHGSALEFFRNNALDARNYFNSKPDPPNPFHNNQFGGSLGGPILRDKTFFFVDYEGLRESGAQASSACVPKPSLLATATNPVIINLLKRNPWPAPKASDPDCAGSEGQQTAANTPFRNRVDSAIVKIDHNITKDHLLTGRYYLGDSDQSFPLALVGGGVLPRFNTSTPTRVQLVSISWVAVLSSTQVNEARVGWNRFAEGFFPEDRNFDPSSIGLGTGVGPQDFGLPFISVGGFASLGASKTTPRFRVDTNWHFIDNFSWKFGRHHVKFGYEFRRTSIAQVLDTNFRGKLTFDTLSDFLAGLPSGGGQARGNSNRNSFENNHGWFVQDSFRWTPRLTLNLGLRWDYFGIVNEKRDLFSNFIGDAATGALQPMSRLYEPDYNNFAPRVSIAWDATGKGKTVVRAGYGIFYDAFSQDFFLGHLPFNCVFCPGPAYNPAGPAASIITSGSANPGPLSSSTPVFGGFGPNSDLFAADRGIRTPYMQNYNLNIEQQLGGHAVLQVGYVGSNGHKLFRFRDINQPTQAQVTAADIACAGAGNPLGSDCEVAARPNSTFFYINKQETTGNSNYNALQTTFRIHNWHGLDSQLNFVWSHSIDDSSDGEDFVPNAAQPNDSSRAKLEKGNSNFDIRRRLVWTFTYAFPNRQGSWSKLTDGWGINGVLTLQDGQPFHLNYNFQGDYDGSGGFFGRPDVVGPIRINSGDPRKFLDLSSFAVPCTLSGTGAADTDCLAGSRHFGNLGRNSLRGPDLRQFDFSIFKNTNVGKSLKVQFRAEFFNLFNRPNFSNPYLPLFIADAAPNGIAVSGRSTDFLQLAATGDVGIGYPFLGGGAPRGIQLALKLLF